MVIEYFLEWIKDASITKRAETAASLIKAYHCDDIQPDEREDVEAALTLLLDDPAPAVRIALANAIGAKSDIPRHVVSGLAADVSEVSVIILSRSPIFHDSELVDFIVNGELDKQIAIACRPWLSPQVLSTICQYAVEEACMGVLANPVADFSKDDMHHIATRFGESADIRNLLLDRTDLAAETRLLLIGKLSSQLSTFVTGNDWISEERAVQAAEEAHDKAAINFAASVPDEDVARIARSLIEQGKMNVSFMLRAVCMGNITLVAHVISELSGVRFSRVEAIMTKDRRSAFKAVYARAGLPKSAFNVFACAISTWRRLLLSGSKINQARMPFLVTREVLDLYSGQSDETVDELMVLLRRLSAEAARDNAKSKALEVSKRLPDSAKQACLPPAQISGIDGLDGELEALMAEEIESELADIPQTVLPPKPDESTKALDYIMGANVPEAVVPEVLAELLDPAMDASDASHFIPYTSAEPTSRVNILDYSQNHDLNEVDKIDMSLVLPNVQEMRAA